MTEDDETITCTVQVPADISVAHLCDLDDHVYNALANTAGESDLGQRELERKLEQIRARRLQSWPAEESHYH